MSKQSSILSFFGTASKKPTQSESVPSISLCTPSAHTVPSRDDDESPMHAPVKRLRKSNVAISDDDVDENMHDNRRDSCASADFRYSTGAMSPAKRRTSLEPASKASFVGPLPEEVARIAGLASGFWPDFVFSFFEGLPRFDFPSFLDPRKLKDSQGRSPESPDFDATTLHVPRKGGKVVEEGHSTPMLQQYWEVKAEHFADLVLFKVGKFYEIFYTDAIIAQRVCGLKWMGNDRKAHVGFPESSLHAHALSLLSAGYRAVVVEQTETVSEATERAQKATAIVKREVCEVFTAGTLVHEDMLGSSPAARMLVSLALNVFNAEASPIGFCAADCASGEVFYTELREDTRNFQVLRSMLYQLQPKEIILSATAPAEVHALLRALPSAPQITRWAGWEPYLEISTSRPAQVAAGGLVSYLNHLKLDELVRSARWIEKNPVCDKLVMDAAALAQLEILVGSGPAGSGSLFDFLNQTSTAFGARALRRWVCAPLRNIEEISRRQEVIAWLNDNPRVSRDLQEKMKKLPDVERKIQKICSLAQQQSRGAVFFTDIEQKRISVFHETLEIIEKLAAVLEILRSNDPPPALAAIAAPAEVDSFCANLRARLGKTSDGSWQPAPGGFAAFDDIKLEISAVEKRLTDELKRIRSDLGTKEANFVHVKYRYEVECPDEYARSVEATSTRKGYIRFQPENIKILAEEMTCLEQKLKDCLYPFMAMLFSEFSSRRESLASLVERVANLDCFLALAQVSSSKGYCRPEFISGPPLLEISSGRHPIQELQRLQTGDREFVPNDIFMKPPSMLITGPNMGGKSTVLRQTCLCVILAQLGCNVPATKFRLSPVDQIFTRLGARDSLLEGKSTFLVELEETAAILRNATVNSLAILDELGRGTSTDDGAAIAAATLSFINDLGCRCLFATHYHSLIGEFPGVCHAHMSYSISEGVVKFEYKLKEGSSPNSQALNVAKLAGLSDEIIKEAAKMTEEFVNCGCG